MPISCSGFHLFFLRIASLQGLQHSSTFTFVSWPHRMLLDFPKTSNPNVLPFACKSILHGFFFLLAAKCLLAYLIGCFTGSQDSLKLLLHHPQKTQCCSQPGGYSKAQSSRYLWVQDLLRAPLHLLCPSFLLCFPLNSSTFSLQQVTHLPCLLSLIDFHAHPVLCCSRKTSLQLLASLCGRHWLLAATHLLSNIFWQTKTLSFFFSGRGVFHLSLWSSLYGDWSYIQVQTNQQTSFCQPH